MRRANAVITSFIMILFLVHMIWGGLELLGLTKGGSSLFFYLSRIMLAFVLIHMLISFKMTLDTLIACRRSGVSYWKDNKLFWIRRISGIALMFFMACHVMIFRGQKVEGSFLLNYFGIMELLSQLLLVFSLLVHLTTNIRPLKIAFGIEDKGSVRTDLLLVLSILLLLSGLAFVIYYIRWQVI